MAKINFHGLARYQQAGIIVYGDDDNYTKLDRGATNAATGAVTEKFEFINEVAATARNTLGGLHGQHRPDDVPERLLPADRL